MYKKLMNGNLDRKVTVKASMPVVTKEPAANKAATPVAHKEGPVVKTPSSVKLPAKPAPKGPQNAKGLTMEKLFSAMELMATSMDEELGIRDKRLDRLDGDVLDHEERLAKLEGSLKAEKSSPAEETPKSDAPAKSKVQEPKETNAGFTGPGRAYRYWDYQTRTYGLLTKAFAAKQIDKNYDIVYVWYNNGAIHHLLDIEEIKKYFP